jgi:hypothetical protein
LGSFLGDGGDPKTSGKTSRGASDRRVDYNPASAASLAFFGILVATRAVPVSQIVAELRRPEDS